MTAPIRLSPLAGSHRDLGATFERTKGWEIVAGYPGERSLSASPLSVADITARTKVDVRGGLTASQRAAGGLVAEITSEWALVVAEPGADETLVPALEASVGPASTVTDATHVYVGIALLGPGIDDLLARLTPFDPSSLAPATTVGAPILDVPAVLFRRDLPVPCIELYLGTEYARFAWSSILDMTTHLGGGPVGWNALHELGWN